MLTTTLQGMKASNKQDKVVPHLEAIAEFLHRSATDTNRTEEVLKAAVGLIGDLGQTFGAQMAPLFAQPFVANVIAQALTYEDMIQTARWAQQVSLC